MFRVDKDHTKTIASLTTNPWSLPVIVLSDLDDTDSMMAAFEGAYAFRSGARKRAAFSPRAGRQAGRYNSAMSE
jgi:hypothetical protein